MVATDLSPDRNSRTDLVLRLRVLAARVPITAWVVLGLFLFSAILMAFYTALSAGETTMRLKVQHGFRSAQLNVWVDSKQIYSGRLLGVVKKKFGVIPDSTQGSLSEILTVPSGEHQIRVRVAADDGSSHEDAISGDFAVNAQRTLSVSARRDDLSLNWQGGAASNPESTSAIGWIGHYAGALLLTAAGSIISALTGFAIREIPSQIRARAAASSKS